MARYLSQTRIEGPIWLEPDDVSFIRARISETETEVEDLDHQMDQLKRSYETQLSNLVRRKDAKLADIASYRNVYSPVRRIPQEILSEIFELYCFPLGGVWYLDWNTSHRTIDLSSVCAAWRKAAHATPRLWSNQYLTPKTHNKAFEGETVWLQEWIDRCQGYPLDLFLDLDNDELYAGARLLELVLRFHHNIRSLRISGLSLSYFPLFQLQTLSLPVLEKVSLRFLDDIDDPDIRKQLVALFPHKISVFLNAPKLRTVEIEEVNENSILQLLLISENCLTSLSVVSNYHDISPTGQYVADMLRRFENLVHLKITHRMEFGPVEMSGISSRLPISLPALKSLKIPYHIMSGSSGLPLLCCLYTPRLEELDLSYDGLDDEESDFLSTDLAIFQRRSSMSLSSLTLRDFLAAEDDSPNLIQNLSKILSLFPSVHSFLMFKMAFDISPLLRALTYTPSHPVLLPKLMHFGVCYYFGKDCSPDLTAMILSRSWSDNSGGMADGPCRLQKVELHEFDFVDTAQISQLPGPVEVFFRDLAYDSNYF